MSQRYDLPREPWEEPSEGVGGWLYALLLLVICVLIAACTIGCATCAASAVSALL